jgi:hypothetical protein
MPQSEREQREAAHVARAERTHQAVMAMLAREPPGATTYTWRDRYLELFRRLWDRPPPPTPE